MPAIRMDDTYDATRSANRAPPRDESAIVICLIVIPVIWITLIMGMLGYATGAIELALVLATLAGGAGGAARHVWLVRWATWDRHPMVRRAIHLI